MGASITNLIKDIAFNFDYVSLQDFVFVHMGGRSDYSRDYFETYNEISLAEVKYVHTPGLNGGEEAGFTFTVRDHLHSSNNRPVDDSYIPVTFDPSISAKFGVDFSKSVKVEIQDLYATFEMNLRNEHID